MRTGKGEAFPVAELRSLDLLTCIRLAIGINWIVPIGALGHLFDGLARWLHARWTHG
jgi:hypothetical protein